MLSLTDRALDWAIAAVDHNPQLSSNLPLFTEEFKRVFEHPTKGGRCSRAAAQYSAGVTGNS